METLIERYEKVSEIIFDQFDDDPLISDQKKTYREQLFGPDFMGAVPEEYSDMEICEKYRLLFWEWEELPLRSRGKMRAFSILQNMKEVIREHKQLSKSKRDKLAKKNVSQKKG